ncbi:hypothetical protein NW759_016828 [Fusarium solani]|nr:hypothetical protein NW759_016828 [Fusarium solani]
MLLQADIGTQQLDRMLCLCALALYEMSNGNGTQAWCDIGTAQSLIPLISQSEMDTLSKDVFKTCLSFLAWTRAEFALGNPTLLPYVLACNDIEPDIDLGELCGPAGVHKAASLLVRCADYAIRTPRNETPWQHDSTFSKLKLKLDQFSITIAENPDLDPGGFSASLADRSELVVDITMSLLRDYCSILLNRNFLPMPPLLSRTHENSATEAQPSKLFFDGRVSACEGSAESIYELCTVLISNQLFILPPFLGYCCFQAAVIFASSLVGYKDQTRREEIFYRLQVLCMVLGALRRLYKPTKLWIDALLKIRAALNETRSEPEAARSTDKNFFSRFRDVVEPPLVTLTCPKVDDIHTGAKTTDNTTPKAAESCQARPAPWIESYQMRLNKQVSALGSIHEESPKNFGDAATGSAKFNNQIAAQLDSLAGQEPSETVQPAVDMHNVAASDSSNTFYVTHAGSLDNDPGLSLGIENLIRQPQSQMVTDGGLLEEMVDETMQVGGPDFFSIDFSQYFDIGESMLDTFGFDWKE